MKNAIYYCHKALLISGLIGVACLLQSCPSNKNNEFYSLTGATKGSWEWVQTTTPTRTITPQSIGYTQQVAVTSDNAGAYIAFYRNDTLQRRENETSTDTAHTFVDDTRRTVTVKYGGAGFIKYTLIVDNTTLTISEFLPNSYTPDTVKNVYKKANPVLYPY